MVKLRLKRFGRRNRPYYRLNAMDQRAARDGRVIEELGWFDPLAADGKQHELKTDRIQYWFSVGAQPSGTVADLLRKSGYDLPERLKKTSGKKLMKEKKSS
ncbi:30S ribosomal protein S16 [Phycisphaerales bacterium AB-hyl4]|uniref:Small ribosomal subunit protein bS16 n=1 Tax=Natronomicrosphaera hydrolytica TaxID=3242702 RepID=A0ABV4U2C1_9BACT